MSKEITSREQDYAQWYNDLVIKGSLADYSAVRGCMVIKPYGFALWEKDARSAGQDVQGYRARNGYFLIYT